MLQVLEALYTPALENRARIIRVARKLRAGYGDMADGITTGKQNITISINPELIRKAKILAARRSTSVSGLIAEQIEALVGADEMYARAERAALAQLEEGFHLSGVIAAGRDEWHER